jgi:hypothetical protein
MISLDGSAVFVDGPLVGQGYATRNGQGFPAGSTGCMDEASTTSLPENPVIVPA